MRPDVLAAAAATIAAVLSGLGLWVGGRREERRWRRDALVDALVQVLDSSFASPGEELMRRRSRGDLTTEDRAAAAEAHAAGISALTRLRLMAGPDVVEAAELLHMADDTGSDMVLSQAEVPDEATWSALVGERRALRDRLLSAARRELGLGPARPIHPGRQVGRVTDR